MPGVETEQGRLRPESLRIDQDKIKLVGEPLPASVKGWRQRIGLLAEPMQSVEAVQAAQVASGTSLAMIRPKDINGLVIEKAKPWTAKQKAYILQQNFDLGTETSRQLRDLEQIPFTFSYRFTCDDDRCVNGHKLQVIDWEVASRTGSGRWTMPTGGKRRSG